jgi:hypothetical protein
MVVAGAQVVHAATAGQLDQRDRLPGTVQPRGKRVPFANLWWCQRPFVRTSHSVTLPFIQPLLLRALRKCWLSYRCRFRGRRIKGPSRRRPPSSTRQRREPFRHYRAHGSACHGLVPLRPRMRTLCDHALAAGHVAVDFVAVGMNYDWGTMAGKGRPVAGLIHRAGNQVRQLDAGRNEFVNRSMNGAQLHCTLSPR